jgi:hypothetical protein
VTAARLSIFIPSTVKVYSVFVMIVVSLSVIPSIHPLSLINVTICMYQTALSIRLAIIPKAFIDRSIGVEKYSKTFTLSILSIF